MRYKNTIRVVEAINWNHRGDHKHAYVMAPFGLQRPLWPKNSTRGARGYEEFGSVILSVPLSLRRECLMFPKRPRLSTKRDPVLGPDRGMGKKWKSLTPSNGSQPYVRMSRIRESTWCVTMATVVKYQEGNRKTTPGWIDTLYFAAGRVIQRALEKLGSSYP